MQPSLKSPPPAARNWIYASLTVIDGQRRLTPAQVGPEFIVFDVPPHIASSRVEVIVTNGDAEYRRTAAVLPHEADATRIPIQLLSV